MSKFKTFAAVVAVLPVLAFTSPVLAAGGPGQIIDSPYLYYGKNLTQNGEYQPDTLSGVCGDTLLLKSRIHNGGPDSESVLTNVKVVATLPSEKVTSYKSTLTVSSPDADPKSVSDDLTLKSDKLVSIDYIKGSTELLDANQAAMQTLPDGITDNGVTLPGELGVSIDNKRFVQFKVKLNCADKPKEECKPGIPVGDKRCDTKTVTTPPTTLTKTGPGEVAAIFAAAVALGTAAYAFVLRRQNAR